MKEIEISGNYDGTYAIFKMDSAQSDEVVGDEGLREYLRKRGMMAMEISRTLDALKLAPRKVRRWVLD